MKLQSAAFCVVLVGGARVAAAGGAYLPGAGAISTARAGAGVASADDGEALVLNPAGLAKTHGTTITISAAFADYAMSFQRAGTYDAVPNQNLSYAGQPYLTMKNQASPTLGIGTYQPLPVIAVISDLGGRVPGLHLALGLYAPNAYPARDMCTQLASGCRDYVFNNDTNPPPATRYDVMKQDVPIILPTIAAAYSILPNLDIGARFSWGIAQIKDTSAVWAGLGPNYVEDVRQDGTVAVDAKDNFVPAFGFGLTYRLTPSIELAANYSSALDVHAKGTSVSQIGPDAGAGLPVTIGPTPDARARCATGGTLAVQKACVDFELPATAQVAGRYKFLDNSGKLVGDVELDLDWEHWGKSCGDTDVLAGTCTSPSDFRVVADSEVYLNGVPAIPLNDVLVRHNFRDTYGIRVGGSYQLPLGGAPGKPNQLILRGGFGYETAAAEPGWLRADLDGAARTTITAGVGYRMPSVEIDIGGGASLEGSPTNPNIGGGSQPCNPTDAMPTCGSSTHQGPDPVAPLTNPADPTTQAQSPFNQGKYTAHYTLFMLGATTWF